MKFTAPKEIALAVAIVSALKWSPIETVSVNVDTESIDLATLKSLVQAGNPIGPAYCKAPPLASSVGLDSLRGIIVEPLSV